MQMSSRNETKGSRISSVTSVADREDNYSHPPTPSLLLKHPPLFSELSQCLFCHLCSLSLWLACFSDFSSCLCVSPVLPEIVSPLKFLTFTVIGYIFVRHLQWEKCGNWSVFSYRWKVLPFQILLLFLLSHLQAHGRKCTLPCACSAFDRWGFNC